MLLVTGAAAVLPLNKRMLLVAGTVAVLPLNRRMLLVAGSAASEQTHAIGSRGSCSAAGDAN